jgi:hypothetical protein
MENTEATFDEQTKNALASVLSKVDFKNLTKEEVVADIVAQSKMFSFRMLIASALIEEINKQNK